MGPALDVVDGGLRFVHHLDVKDLDAVEPHGGCPVDAGLDPEPLAAELPEGVSRDADMLARWPGPRWWWILAGRIGPDPGGSEPATHHGGPGQADTFEVSPPVGHVPALPGGCSVSGSL